MKKTVLTLIAAIAMGATSIVFAADTSATDKPALMQKSDGTVENAIIAKLKQHYPSTRVDSVSKSVMDGIYEVRMGDKIAYVDKEVKYFLFGHIFDMATQQDLTQAKINEFDKVDFDKLPFQYAIKVKKGNGKHVFAAFTDPECPFCQRLESSLTNMTNYTMYVFLFPLTQLHPASMAKSTAIWCSKDRAKAYTLALTTGIDETKVKTCDTPLDMIHALGEHLKVAGTPTLIRSDGVRLPGYAPAPTLMKWLEQAKAAKPIKTSSR